MKLFVSALAGLLLVAFTLMAAVGSNGAGRFSLEDYLPEGFPRGDGLVSYSFAEEDCSRYVVVQYDPDKTESILITITSLDLASTATYYEDDEGGYSSGNSTEAGKSFSSYSSPGKVQIKVSAEELEYELEVALEARDGK